METGLDEFFSCKTCKKIVEKFHHWRYRGEQCVECIDARNPDPSRPPWPPHMMESVEPYIQYRCNQAVNDHIRTMALRYLEKNEKHRPRHAD